MSEFPNIREYSPEDKEKIAEILRKVCREDWEGASFSENMKHFDLDDMKFVVEDEGEILGALTLNDTVSRALEIGIIFVKEEYRSEGVGREMLEFAEEKARKMDKEILRVFTGATADWAIDFYKACGFELNGTVGNFERKGSEEVFLSKVIV